MDFTPSTAAAAVAEATDEVTARLTPDWTEKFTRSDFEGAAWRAFAEAGLTVLALPEAFGGDSLPLDALIPLAAGAGQVAAVTPLVATLTATAVLASSPATAARWAQAVADGGWAAIAVGERGETLGAEPRVELTGEPGRRTLTGTKTGVGCADGASALLVSTDDGTVVVDPGADGVTLRKTPTSSGVGEYTVTFDAVPVHDDDVLSDDGPGLADVYRALLGAYVDGLLSGALSMTAAHVVGREQFGRPIAAFQAVGQQLADIYVVSRTLNLIVTSAAWRVATGRDAEQDLATASYWVATEVPAALRTMTHLHGGVGVDLTYPLHRYFSLAKDLARLTGGSEQTLEALACM
ncbi:MAG: acyl-CoA dehydrogenase family protein [Gordonia sp. (in: high G+C Gram-positive bacteria)]|uniref:acyl-CoA dehydrogenase family protein n=1 Tax=Gordonia sp. (in: high G+C Gram-positive bacteria) TaxID=84139 RepID=UPI003BB6BEAD